MEVYTDLWYNAPEKHPKSICTYYQTIWKKMIMYLEPPPPPHTHTKKTKKKPHTHTYKNPQQSKNSSKCRRGSKDDLSLRVCFFISLFGLFCSFAKQTRFINPNEQNEPNTFHKPKQSEQVGIHFNYYRCSRLRNV